MKRKVVKHGPSTYIVSLPSPWVKRYGIQKGDELEVNQNGRSIIISQEKTRQGYKITADVSGLVPRLVDRFLARTYQKGYDQISLIHNDISMIDTIQAKIHELIGYEIIEQGHKVCHIQSISSRIELDFDNALTRAFLIIKQMAESCHDNYKAGNTDELTSLYLKDLEVNRHCYFCLRQLNKDHYVMDADMAHQKHVLYYLVEILEDLGDCYKKLASALAGMKKDPMFISLLKRLTDLYEISRSYFNKATKEKANEAYRIYKQMEEEVDSACSKNLKKDSILALMQIREASNIVYHFTTMRLDFIKDSEVSPL